MSQVEKTNLKRKSFAEHLAIVIEASFKDKELDFDEFSKKKMKLTFEVENDPNLAINVDLNTIPPRPTIDAFRLMKDASEEKAEVEKILKEAEAEKKTDLANPSLESPKSFISTEDSEGTKKKVSRRRTFKKEEKEALLNSYIKHGKTFTIAKHKVKEGTLNTIITNFNKNGEKAFTDQRVFNSRPCINNIDDALLTYIKERRKLFLPVSLFALKAKALELNIQSKEFCASETWLRNFLKRKAYL